ncbi:hypothetical protein ABZV52_29840 [Streptomyces sp. NPDC004735]|uniref:hypothetical protein n=1 Tax=Streptomyces sp. NPDC004735 TaxID=3156654 RepID=UPI0033B0AB3B
MRKLRLLAYALALLALAYPAVVPPALGTVFGLALAAAVWVTAHLSLALTIAATVLLARAFPGSFGRSVRWIGRALVVSVASVTPNAA